MLKSVTLFQALEQFIRAKYEKKKYIAKEYVPQKCPEFPDGNNKALRPVYMHRKQTILFRNVCFVSVNSPEVSTSCETKFRWFFFQAGTS